MKWLIILTSVSTCPFLAFWCGWHLIPLSLGYSPILIYEENTWIAQAELAFTLIVLLVSIFAWAFVVKQRRRQG